MSITTDADYNAASREIQMKLEICFDGMDPLVATHDNYIVSCDLLEESQSDSRDIIGDISSNELSFTMHNNNGIFTLTNPDSPYHNKMVRNVPINVYGRVIVDSDEETEWDPLGTYYVKEWQAEASGMIVSVTANDTLYDIFDAAPPTSYVFAKNSLDAKGLYKEFFDALSISSNIDESLSMKLTYGFFGTNNKTFLNDLSNAALAICYGNREGGVTVESRLAERELRATLTDDDQIISVKTAQTITVGYDGVSVTCNAKQESAPKMLLSLKEHSVPTGIFEDSTFDVSGQLVRLSYGLVKNNEYVHVKSMSGTKDTIDITFENTSEDEQIVDVDIYGTILETISIGDADDASNLLEVNSPYVQSLDQAELVKKYLRRIAVNNLPTLELTIRGNFKLQVGDRIKISSVKYKTEYTGVLIRASYHYQGSLSCDITLVDAKLFGGDIYVQQ